MPKAKVLPEPVDALPMTSCPSSISGIDDDWIRVGLAKCSFASEVSISDGRPKWFHADTTDRLVIAYRSQETSTLTIDFIHQVTMEDIEPVTIG